MKKVLITILMCVLVFCYPSWGCQNEHQDCVGGLIDILLDVVTTPCSLLAACLGLDAGPCAYQSDQKMQCAPLKERRHHARVNPATRRSASPVSASKASSVSLSESEKKPTKFSEPLRPVQEPIPVRSTPPVSKPVSETTKFPEPKKETSVPIVHEVAPVPSTAVGPAVSPLRPQDRKTSEVETGTQKGPASPLFPSVIPVNPDNFVSQQPANPHSVKKPIPSENGKAAIKTEPSRSTLKVVVPNALPETEKSDKGKKLRRSKFKRNPCGPVSPPVCGPRFFYR
ncbi:MAG: hypothetical protein ACLPVO_05865 [Desulfomonilaceae bacterium]